MNERLKQNIIRRLDELPDDVGRQLADYLEFLDSKYNRSRRELTTLERIAEGLEGRLGVGGLGSAAVKGTSQVIDTAGNVVRGVAAAGRAVVEELQRAEREPREGDGETQSVAQKEDDVAAAEPRVAPAEPRDEPHETVDESSAGEVEPEKSG